MYLFLFGRDYKLSTLELLSYLKLNNISYSLISTTTSYAIFDFKNQKLNFNNILNDLGGITRIYRIFHKSEKFNSDFLNKFDVNYPKKFNYSISSVNITLNQIQFLTETFKEQFKFEKTKAVYKKPKKQQDKKENTIVNPNNYYSYGLDKGFELFVSKHDNIYYYGVAIACYDPKELITKDTLRPMQEKLHSTSFRLTKIMINLLGLKKGKRILDPFCGLGTFLIEGLYQGYQVIGIDKDRDMVVKSKKNLIWAIDHFKLKDNYTVLNGDSSTLRFSADAVVFEPYMGPFISKLPNADRVNNILGNLKPLYDNLFKNLYNNLKPKTKVIFILPEFKTYDGKLFGISDNIFLKNGFEYSDFSKINAGIDIKNPIFYQTPNDSKINRYIYIIERK